MSIKWLLFDLDNTLLDFDAGARDSLHKMLLEHGYPEDQALIDSYHQINHQCWQQFEKGEIDIRTLKKLRFEIFTQENRLVDDPAVMNRNYLNRLAQQTNEVPGARHLLDKTKQRFRLVLVTNGFAEVQRPRITSSGLHHYFEHIVISEEIGCNKPEPAFFDHVFRLMGHPDPRQVLIIGDSLSSDIRGGLDYGILTCWFNQHGAQKAGTVIPHQTVHSLDHILSFL